MRIKSLRWLVLLMAVLMLCPLLFACKKDSGGGDQTSEVPGSETENPYRDNITETFADTEVHFVSRSFDWYRKEVTVAQEDIEDPVDQSVYNRQCEVEERLEVLIENHLIDGTGTAGYSVVVDAVRQDEMAGTHYYDIAVNNMYHTMEVVTDGLFKNLYEVPNVTLTQPYYSQYYNEQATVSNKLFSTTGDASLTFIKFALVTFFNKKIQVNYNLENFYDVVKDGDWTIDYQYNIVKDMHTELDDDGVRSAGDLYGFVTNQVTCVDPYTSSLKLDMVGRDTNGKLISVAQNNTAHFTEALEKILDLYGCDGAWVLSHKTDDGEYEDAKKMLAADRALFTTLRLEACEDYTLRDMTSDYGIIPMPKFNAEQEQYYSYCHDLFSVYCVCNSIEEKRLPAVGATLEVFFSQSESCRHNLFDVALKYKYQRSEEASQMLDLIIDNVKIDAGWIYSGALADFGLVIRNAVQKGTKNFSGIWKAQGGAFVAKLGLLQEGFDKMQ